MTILVDTCVRSMVGTGTSNSIRFLFFSRSIELCHGGVNSVCVSPIVPRLLSIIRPKTLDRQVHLLRNLFMTCVHIEYFLRLGFFSVLSDIPPWNMDPITLLLVILVRKWRRLGGSIAHLYHQESESQLNFNGIKKYEIRSECKKCCRHAPGNTYFHFFNFIFLLKHEHTESSSRRSSSRIREMNFQKVWAATYT